MGSSTLGAGPGALASVGADTSAEPRPLAAARRTSTVVRLWSRRASGLGAGRLAWPSYLLLALLVAAAALLRFPDLGVRSMWVDEAESSINAITILEHGLPVDHYLGTPIYENTLVEPWPE